MSWGGLQVKENKKCRKYQLNWEAKRATKTYFMQKHLENSLITLVCKQMIDENC